MYPYMLFLVLCVFVTGLSAQDVHFSMFNMSPLTLNPAQTGAFEGTARIGGIYRGQWNVYTTPSFFVDAPVVRGFRKSDWVGVGLVVVNDIAGVSQLRTQGSNLSASYHLAFDRKRNTVLTLGFQTGSITRNFRNTKDFTFADELPTEVGGGGVGVGKSQDRSGVGTKSKYRDINFGLMLRTHLKNKDLIEAGFSLAHITQPKYGLLNDSLSGQGKARRPSRITIHGRWNHQITDKISIAPQFLVQATKGGAEIVLQALGGLQINKDVKLNAGPGYRVGDAAMVIFGLDYQDLKVGVAYDINSSSLSSNGTRKGGYELAANYILKLYKKPVVPPAILCPKL